MKSLERLIALTIISIISTTLLSTHQASADESEGVISIPDKCETRFSHVLDGHSFLPTFTIPTPFANSSALIAIGFGYGDQSGVNLLGFTPRAEGQVKIIKGLALSFGVAGHMLTGSDGSSALEYGASAGYSYKLGALYELIRSEKDVFSVAVELEHPNSFAVSPLESARSFIKGLINNAASDFVSNTVVNQWRPNVRWAHAFSPPFGLQALFGLKINQRKPEFRESTSSTRLQIGAQFETDFKPWVGVPFGLTLSYLRGQVLGSTLDLPSNNTISLGLYLTSSAAFNVGLEYGIVHSGDLTTRLGGVVARMYFN